MSQERIRHRNVVITIVVMAVIAVVLLVPVIPVDTVYSETEPYTRTARYEVVSATLSSSWNLARGTYHISEVKIKSLDAYGGTFTVTHYLYDVNGLVDTANTNNYVTAGQTVTFRVEFDTEAFRDYRAEYSVLAPNVIDQHVVTKHRTAYKSVIQLLIGS